MINYPAKSIHCRLAGWGSEDLYNAGKNSFMRVEVSFPLPDWGYTEISLYQEVMLRSRRAADKNLIEITEIDGLHVSPLLAKGVISDNTNTAWNPFKIFRTMYDTEDTGIKLGLASSD